MKKFKNTTNKLIAGLLSASLVFSLIVVPAQAGDTWPFKGESAHGENQSSVHGYTSGHIKDWSPETDPGAELMRSHVPLQQRINAFAQTQANPLLNPNVKMFDLAGDYGNAFIENAPYTNKFAQYHLNFWQYIDYYSPWHGTATAYTPPEYYDDLAQKEWQQKWFEFGFLNIPNPTYTDAAHKNGVLSLGGTFFSNNDRGQQTNKQMLVKDENGKYTVAEKMVEMAHYFGYDGYFFNQEELSPNVATADIPDYIAFLKVFQNAGLYVQWYDSLDTTSGENSFARQIGDSNISMLYDKNTNEKVTNSFFFDYDVGSSQISSTNSYLATLNSTYGTSYNIFDVGFAGLEAGRDRFGNSFSGKLGADGVPATSIATLGADFVHAGLDEDMLQGWPVSHRAENDYQWMTTIRERLWWSGPNQDPKNTATASQSNVSDVYVGNMSWTGVASAIAERSVIGGTNFYTNFNTGHGLSYYADGQVSNNDEWSNMSLQDIPVTWQWWQDTTGNKLDADFDYGTKYTMTGNTKNRFSYQKIGGYNGGSSLVVNGKLTAEDFLRLYKTELSIKASSKVAITYNKPSNDDTSAMSVGLIFKDAPATVVKVPVIDSGKKTTGWTSAELDLSAYAGKTIAALGLVFDNGGVAIDTYQMNIGQVRIFDGSAIKPAAPTGLAITNAFTNSNEMNINWDMNTDYSKVKQYNIYINNVYVGGKYDSMFYIKKMPAKSGTIKVVPVGADGTEGDAATLAFNLDKAVSEIKVDSKEDGTFKVSWTNPVSIAGDITVKVKSVNLALDKAVSDEMTVTAGSTSALFTDMPINGDDFIVTINIGTNDSVSYCGNFIDKVCEQYAEKWSLVGDKINIPMPNTRDWHYMYVYEDGVAKQFATTYNQGSKPMIIRGRSTKECLSFTSTAKNVSVVMEDYAGNKSTPLFLKISEITSKDFPDATLLKWVKDNIGSTLDKVALFSGTLDISGLQIKDLTGLKLFSCATEVNLTNNPIELLDQNMLPANVNNVNLTDCKNLLYIREKAFTGINKLKTINITGCSKLKLLSLKDSTITDLIYGDKAAFPDLIALDFRNTSLNVKSGSPARIFADYIKTQVVEGQNITFEESGIISTVKDGSPVISGTSFDNPSVLFDGNIDENTGSFCSSDGGSVVANFQKDVVMNGYSFYTVWGGIPKNFKAYYSEDGENYTQIGDAVSNNTVENYKTTFATPVKGKYFKFEVLASDNYFNSLSEIQILGSVPTIYPSSVKFNGSDGLVVTEMTPKNGDNDVHLFSPLKITFADKVAIGAGNITIYNGDDSIFQTISVVSEQVSISDDTVTIRHNKFELGRTYYVLIHGNTFKDPSGIPYAGISMKTDWNFTATATPDTTAPAEVVVPTVKAGDGQLTITWADPADVDFDHVIVTGAGITIQNIGKGLQKAAITGLENGKTYDITLKTVDMEGNESTGVTINGIPSAIVVPDTTAPAEVTEAIVTVGDGQMTITWSDPADVDFYQVIVTGAGITVPNVNKGKQSVTITGLSNGTTYTIILKTVDINENESTGISVNGTPSVTVIPDTTAPAEVTGAIVTAGDGQLTITWTDPADVDFYQVIVTGAGITVPNVNKGKQSVTITGLSNGTTYTIILKTVDKKDHTSAGISVSGTPKAVVVTPSSTSTVTQAPEKLKVVEDIIKIIETPKLDAVTGVAAATPISEENMKKALGNAKGNSDGIKTVTVEIPKVTGAKTYAVELPKSILTSDLSDIKVKVITEIGTIMVPSNMFKVVDVAGANSIVLNLGIADTSRLNAATKEKIGNRPVINLEVKVNGKKVEWNNPDARVTVSIPYSPTPEERNNSEHIVVWYVNDKGEVAPISNGKYNVQTGMVTFTTTHFSEYAVAYVNKTYTDVTEKFWANKPIGVMASKGIIEGTSDMAFSPKKSITRGEFISWLVKTLGLTATIDSNFVDVESTDVCYLEVGIAKALGITTGVGNNKFSPQTTISRQDMMVLTIKAMKIANITLPVGNQNDIAKFADSSKVASYALENVAAMVKSGIVSGDGKNLNPISNITRAEATQILYKVYNMIQ